MPDTKNSRRAALAALAIALGPTAALAQHDASPTLHTQHEGSPVEQMTAEQRAEHQRQLASLLTAVMTHADFDAVDQHVQELIRANASEIGGDTEALAAHVSAFLDHVQEAVQADPQMVGGHMAQVLIEVHTEDR